MKILGISSGHDSGAAIIEDGKILVAVNEERLSRIKGHWGHPFLSIKKCFEISGIAPEEISKVALANITLGGGIQQNFNSGTFRKKLVDLFSFSGLADKTWVRRLYLGIFRRRREEPELLNFLAQSGVRSQASYIEHHAAHAASAYYASRFGLTDRVLILTSDSSGDGLSTTISVADGQGRILRKHETSFFHSPSVIYSYVTHNLGFKYLQHEGKITGLAAFGDSEKTIGLFRRLMTVDLARLEFRSHLGCWGRPAARKLKKLCEGFSREDIAAGVQRRIEEVCSELTSEAMRRYNCDKLCLAGGIFANVRLNQKLSELPEVSDLYIFPHMGDGGVAAGAALAAWSQVSLATSNIAAPQRLGHIYLGPEFNAGEIEQSLKQSGLDYRKSKIPEREIAQLLAEGKIVARFTGAMEYGPRALGNRSILYQATDREVNTWLNKQLRRTEFMPFAPILLAKNAAKYFKHFETEKSFPSEFMTITYAVTDLCKQEAPAIVHVDGTARPQTVLFETNPSMSQILSEYERLSGKAILVNTSFNMHEEPIVCSPEDAIRAFRLGSLDALAIGDFLVKNNS